jgi:hypothetical protein
MAAAAIRPFRSALQIAQDVCEIGDVLGAVAGRVGIGDVLSDHGLTGRGMARLCAGERKDLEPVEHRGFSHIGYTDA